MGEPGLHRVVGRVLNPGRGGKLRLPDVQGKHGLACLTQRGDPVDQREDPRFTNVGDGHAPRTMRGG